MEDLTQSRWVPRASYDPVALEQALGRTCGAMEREGEGLLPGLVTLCGIHAGAAFARRPAAWGKIFTLEQLMKRGSL